MAEDTRDSTTLALLGRYRAGEPSALDALIERYYARVERIVRVRLGAAVRERAEVADVVQDVFIRIVESVETFEPRSDSGWIDWVARLAQNEIANHARHDRAAKRGGELAGRIRSLAESASRVEPLADSTAVHSKASRSELTEILDRCLAELPEPHREVILLRDYAGGDWKSVAEQMGRPSAEACQELYRRARRELGRKMQARV